MAIAEQSRDLWSEDELAAEDGPCGSQEDKRGCSSGGDSPKAMSRAGWPGWLRSSHSVLCFSG